jgi:hypothetical protein
MLVIRGRASYIAFIRLTLDGFGKLLLGLEWELIWQAGLLA